MQKSRAAPRGDADAANAAAALVALWEYVALRAPDPVPRLGLRALAAVERSEELGLTELGRALDITPASASRLCGRLETAGLLARRPHAVDRRRAVLALTPEGVEAVEEMRSQYARVIAAALPRSDDRLHAAKEACEMALARLREVASFGWSRRDT
ncbi:MarR family winged helix-turn-helix transcriptional regulator [Streptomyces sp. NPDC015131]|uniref:MarR family winged helix-turn-helix transcriptional regulator n=1 Tax=Streptomyces sp. NPDC015131 TaxID=3364941 RepID=UPI003701EDE3